jgi:hypothetical protein
MTEKLEEAGLAAAKARTMPEWISSQWRAGWAAHHAREIESVEGYLNSLRVGLIEQAASQLLSISQNAPEQGSLHHTTMIHADALMGIAEALTAWNTRPSVVPEGFKLVPVEPTEAMWQAAERAGLGDHGEHHEVVLARIWSAMLLASQEG